MAALNVTQASRIVAATELGTIQQVARDNEVSGQTVRNHLAREAKGKEPGATPALQAFAAACRKERDLLQAEKERRRHEWADLAVSGLRSLLGALEQAGKVSADDFATGKIEKGRIRELAGAVKIIGELHLGKSVLFGGSSTARANPTAEEAPDGVRGTGADEVH